MRSPFLGKKAGGVKRGGATVRECQLATILATFAKAVLCALPLLPAVRVNLEGASGQGPAWTSFAIGSVLAGAVFVELVLQGGKLIRSLLFGALAAFFIMLNCLNAIGNAASASDHSRDDKRSQIERKQRLDNRRRELSQARKAQFEIAGDSTPESIEAETQAKKAADAKRWNLTGGCTVEKITAGPSREFCAAIADLERKKAAASKRDDLDRQLRELDDKDMGAAPATTDPYSDNIARFIALLGYAVSDSGKALIASSRDWLKGVGVELLAAFGPAGLLSILRGAARNKEITPAPHRKPTTPAQVKAATMEPKEEAAILALVAAAPDGDAVIDSFVGRRLEVVQEAYIPASTLYGAWCSDCAEHGIEPGSQKAFSRRIQKRVGYDRNNGRPRYCHVKLKVKSPPQLKVVGS